MNGKVITTRVLVRTGSVKVIVLFKINEDTEKNKKAAACNPA
jgi:hypothetical protein